MDTRFWGPSGWRMLHLVAFQAPSVPNKAKLQTFLSHLPYVLPCKYCRASLTDYYGADPIPSDLRSDGGTAHWMFRIHNRVNGKLREQGLLEGSDPQWREIKKRYESWMAEPCSVRRMVGWDFLFSVAFTTPSKSQRSVPMAGAPPVDALTTDALRNRWNTLSYKSRIPYIRTWWSTIVDVLPFPEWRSAWKAAWEVHGAPPLTKGRKATTAWLYKMEHTVCGSLKESAPHTSFQGLCTELTTFSSGCSGKSSKRSKTCRASKRTARQTLKKRRRSSYRQTGGFL